MRPLSRAIVLLSVLLMGSVASAKDFSFREFDSMLSFEKDVLKMEIEQGRFISNKSAPYRDIILDGIQYGNQDDLDLFVMLIIKDVCPMCSTTSSGSTVRVKYGNSSDGGKKAYVLSSSSSHTTRNIEEKCEDLLSNHRRERDGKDILIFDNYDDDDKIALCFDRN